MRSMSRIGLTLVALLLVMGVAAVSVASAQETAKRPQPDWYTPTFHQEVLAAGAEGVQVSEERLNTECPGYASRGVSAAGCIVEPYGCTANFIFTDGSSSYIGTARHCVDDVGDAVVMQVDTTTLAAAGEVVRRTPGDGEPGHDFALVKLYPDVVEKWGTEPALPVVGGPNGIYDGCSTQPVKYYGHGYGVATAQGKPEAGLATNWHDDGYGWTGFGAPGDSGSPVVLADGRAAGNFTHLVVDLDEYPGSDHAGMRMTAILDFLGPAYRLVNADRSTSTAARTSCGSGQ